VVAVEQVLLLAAQRGLDRTSTSPSGQEGGRLALSASIERSAGVLWSRQCP
jgi:hypothetical protein